MEASRSSVVIPPPTGFYDESKDISSQSIIVFAHNFFIKPLDDCQRAKSTIASTKRPTRKSSPTLHSQGRFYLAYATYGSLRHKKKREQKPFPPNLFPFSLKPISISVTTRIGLRPICLQKDRLHRIVLVLLAALRVMRIACSWAFCPLRLSSPFVAHFSIRCVAIKGATSFSCQGKSLF